MPSIPLKAQVGIRDHWTKEDGPLQTTLKNLEEVLGRKVAVDPEWPILLAELGDFYPDKTIFVSIVAGCVQAWAKSVTELIEDEANEEWAETLLEKSRSQIRLYIEVASNDKGSTSWSESRDSFILQLPKKPLYQPTELYPVFRGDLVTCFQEKINIPSRPIGGSDDWADVEMDSATGKAAVVEKSSSSRVTPGAKQESTAADFLPSVSSLPRPDELLSRAPYHLIMHASHLEIEVQCSHSPSLQLLADYLKRWCRVNHNDTRAPPAVDVKLHQSAFGLGEMFDRLELSTKENRFIVQFRVTAPIVLALIEGVLGYKLISVDGSTWNFRRDVEFKRL